ncbi:MAG TPA: zf-HC2 domain-containing protein [Polyangiaceae bacterium]|jgi:tetratricopeptide (TPR) repeat protein|nr:zf-HC2 domain-containing protein [Polyangiaceae bacterium]
MDCEKFDRVVLDLLYGELDELTSAAARRHTEHCTRCRSILSELRATREVGALPLVDPPEGLELRILEAERHGRAGLPLRQRVGRTISVLAGYAMRPQLAMAALLLLVIGSSLIILRGRPGDRDRVMVTERGVPETDTETLTLPTPEPARSAAAERSGEFEPKSESRSAKGAALASAAPAATATAEESDKEADEAAYASGMALYDQGRYVEARRVLESVANRGGARAPDAALNAARATEQTHGCGAAAPLFEQVTGHYPGTPSALEATWQAADCYKTLGELDQARRSYRALFSTSYDDRARSALSRLDDESSGVASRKAKAAARSAPAGAVAGPAADQAAPAEAAKPAPPPPAKVNDSAF